MTQQNMIPPANSNSSSLLSILEDFMVEKGKYIHTQIVCKVLKVNNGMVDVQPLIKTMWKPASFLGEGLESNYPVIFDVPIKFESSKRGLTGLMTPVSVGDVGVLTFSERSVENYQDSAGLNIVNSGTVITHSMDGDAQALCYSGEVFTESSSVNFPTDETLLFYGDSIISLKENKISLRVASGANIHLAPDGKVLINGATITPSGDVITASGVSLNELNGQFQRHTHTGVHGETGKPNY